MPLVNVMVNARAYTIACDEGEEAHLKELAAHVDEKVRELAGSVGQVGDQKLMLMAAVLITDEFFEARGHSKKAKELASAKADLDARVADAEKRAAAAIKDAEAHTARAISDAEKRIADLEAQAAQAASDAQARVNEMRQDAEAQIAEAKRDADARIARALSDAEGAGASAEAEELAMLELDDAASRVERIVERLKAA